MNPTLTYPPQPPRYYSGGYRYFFNGQEADNEVLVEGALHAFEYRMHDTRIGQFWSEIPPKPLIDSLEQKKSAPFSDAPFRLVFVEAFARLSAEQSGANHLAQQRVRTILGIAELFVEHFHDG